MYVHIIDVAYVTFQNRWFFLPKLIRQKYKRYCQTRIYSCCMHLQCVWCTTLPIEYGYGSSLLKNAERFLRYHVKRELTKRTNKWCYIIILCYIFFIKPGIINLHNHMHFFRYLDFFYHPQWCFSSNMSVDTR